jgi:hypothetical protein
MSINSKPLAHITVINFGSELGAQWLARYIKRVTEFDAANTGSEVLVTLPVSRLSEFFTVIASDTKLYWIEYTVQVDLV